tara:strand:+ start:879 stop:1112 length:234 start_codon:yes stop_codon:yes gene_type:complete
MNYNNLPEEIKAKIMFSGYIIHPIAKVFKDFKNDNLDLINNKFNLDNFIYEDLSMYDYLKEMDYFNKNFIYYEDIWL